MITKKIFSEKPDLREGGTATPIKKNAMLF